MTSRPTSGVPLLSGEASRPVALRQRPGAVPDLGHAARAVFERLCAALDALEAERERRALMRELHTLDDWMLADIGLKRHEIESTVRGETPLRRQAACRTRSAGG
jgi:uncharacterized protein YjiS (DUF1127 family)